MGSMVVLQQLGGTLTRACQNKDSLLKNRLDIWLPTGLVRRIVASANRLPFIRSLIARSE